MKPPIQLDNSQDLFRHRLENMINLRHELVLLSEHIDWSHLEEVFGEFYSPNGRPGIPTRLMVGLHLLKHIHGLSDEAICDRWVENPYFQYFCGESYFQHDFPIERSSMTHWRKRIGEEAMERLLQESLMVAYKTKALRAKDLERVVVDTTVQPKAITYPTDAKLYRRAILGLGGAAQSLGVPVRQSYVRVSKRALMMAGRYAHAKQMKRAKKQVRKLRTWLGRLIRDIDRKAGEHTALGGVLNDSYRKAMKIYTQKRTDSNKLLSWHAEEVECIGKGNVDKPYEFGCKVSVTTNVNRAPGGHFVLHTSALHGRPYDGHTLKRVMDEMKWLTGVESKRIYVDKGYRGHDYEKKLRVFKSGQKRGITPTIKRELKRRSVVEPIIGHLKNDGHMGRNYLKGQVGDKINALLSAVGYNFRMILKWLRDIFSCFIEALISEIYTFMITIKKNPLFNGRLLSYTKNIACLLISLYSL